jgi:ABC-type transporter Mla subunit MlaD
MPTDMITKRLSIMDDISEEIKKIKNMIQDSLDNDDDFQELLKSTQEHKEKVKQSKDKISNKSAIKDLELKLKEKKQELKEIKEVLSQELADYYKDEGTMEIEDHKGDIKRLKFSVTLTD